MFYARPLVLGALFGFFFSTVQEANATAIAGVTAFSLEPQVFACRVDNDDCVQLDMGGGPSVSASAQAGTGTGKSIDDQKSTLDTTFEVVNPFNVDAYFFSQPTEYGFFGFVSVDESGEC